MKGPVKKIVRRIRSNLERYNEKNKRLPLSVSIGFATAQDQSKSLAQVLREADEKMYLEKQVKKGKNGW
ncbi:MAG: diguanylate cyclase [Firmicutes bacterium]|jgi:GGDEF domain-containing protein|nr:diguanylate cyclase [Bacillota bacterium]